MNIPTIEELAIKMFIKNEGGYSSFNRVSFTGKQLKEVGIAYTKLHVEAVLEAATKPLDEVAAELWNTYDMTKKAILESYPLTNIK